MYHQLNITLLLYLIIIFTIHNTIQCNNKEEEETHIIIPN